MSPAAGQGRAVILEIVDVWIQVQGLVGGFTLETVDTSPQVQIMRGGVTLETEDQFPIRSQLESGKGVTMEPVDL